jgi:hypothetical protein
MNLKHQLLVFFILSASTFAFGQNESAPASGGLLGASTGSSSSSQTSVNEIKMTHERVFTRSNFALGTSIASLSSKTKSVFAIGPRGGFEYGLFDDLSLGANMAFTFQGSGPAQGSFFYSSISALFKYSLFGSSSKMANEIRQRDGALVYLSRPLAKRRVALMAGIEQLFLNGSTSIYPAIGPTFGTSIAFGLRQYSIELDFTASSLVANDNPIGMVAVGANINLDL